MGVWYPCSGTMLCSQKTQMYHTFIGAGAPDSEDIIAGTPDSEDITNHGAAGEVWGANKRLKGLQVQPNNDWLLISTQL